MRLMSITIMLLTALAGAACEERVADACARAKLVNGWCPENDVGYVASVPVANHALFEALDAHGHAVSIGHVSCRTCLQVMESDGFCESCRLGYVDGEAYFSPLTWNLAQGEPTDVSSLRCDRCRAHAGRWQAALAEPTAEATGWCDRCLTGWVGNVAYRDAGRYQRAAGELPRLLAAVRKSDECEYCAVALFMDARCPRCNITYQGGAAQPPRPGA